MATVEEQIKLFEILKFTPRTYTVSIWGYGGEIVMGSVDRKIYDYFKRRRLSVSEYAWGNEYAEEENIPLEMQPFEAGSWYDCDNMAHTSGAHLDSGTFQVTDENGNVVIEDPLDSCDVELISVVESWISDAKPGEVVFVGRSGEKGLFFEGKFDLTKPFDSTLLEIYYDEVDGETYVSSVYYDGNEIDNNDYSTNGKSSEFAFYLIKDDNSFESYSDHDSIEYSLTEWFSNKINPVYPGNYLIKTPGKNSYEYHARWTGTRWISAWQPDKPETETLKIKQWRGIDHDPESI